MVQLKNINPHQPAGMLIDVDEKKAKYLVDSGQYEYLEQKDKTIVVSKYKENGKPNPSWTEKEIKKWISDKKIPVKYNVSSMTKETILLRLKDGGYL